MKENELVPGASELTGFEIAVIGMSGRFPGSDSIEEFWENLKNGREGIAFFTEEELKEAGFTDKMLQNPRQVKALGWLTGKLFFDAAFFGYTPVEAEIMDPQIRLLHECAYEALENAAYDPSTYKKPIGLYAGASANLPWQVHVEATGKTNVFGWFAAKQLTDKDFLATRISYKLNLRGPAFTLDSACSTSLTAIHLAIQGLLSGDCDIALAGGVTAIYHGKVGYNYEQGMILSSDGHTRAFDARANGSNIGDAAAIVVLKRYSDAVQDRDTLHAVIKGSAINNDGDRKAAYTAPSIEGQSGVIRTALQMAEVDPETITYIETHGTGTTLGDPVEIEGLKAAFNTKKKHFCRIGSVKSNVGHLEMAAGVTGFIKTVLALKHKQIPPTLCFETPNPKIDFANSPFVVNTQLTAWQRLAPGIPRRAGVSSFGIGGTNVHMILEEAPTNRETATLETTPPYQLILLSAKTETALQKMTQNLANHLKKHPHINLVDAVYTLQVGRQVFPHRGMLVCPNNTREAPNLLTQPGKMKTYKSDEDNRPIVFMFPGLGSQYVNMGHDLYEQEPIFREEMNRCFEILEPLLDYDIKEILYPAIPPQSTQSTQSEKFDDKTSAPSAPSAVEINQPGISQIVTFIFEYALARLLMKWGIKPYAMIGYSFGEYTAACVSGVFSLTDALKLIVARGKLLQQAPEGVMLSVPLSRPEISPYLIENKEISLAIDNGPSCVIAGPPQAVHLLEKQVRQKKIMCIPVPVNRALHSQIMEPILEKFAALFDTITLNKPQIPYISNVTGDWLTPREAADAEYWKKHLRETVQFDRGMKTLLKQPGIIFLEIGAGRDISALALRHLEEEGENAKQRVLNLVKAPHQEISDLYFLLNRMGRLWLYGQPIDWAGFYGEQISRRSRISLPSYPFERQLYWNDKDPLKATQELLALSMRKSWQPSPSTDWFYIPSWKRSKPFVNHPWKSPEPFIWLIFQDDCHLGNQLEKQLKTGNQQIIMVKKGNEFEKPGNLPGTYTLDPQKDNHYDLLFRELYAAGKIPARILHLWSITPDSTPALDMEKISAIQDQGYYSLINIARALGKQKIKHKIRISVVTNHLQEVNGDEKICPGKALLLGPVKVIPLEYSNLGCQCIDIILPPQGSLPGQNLINQLLEEFTRESKPHEPVVALRGRQRWVQSIEPLRLAKPGEKKPLLKEKGVYLVTGGLGGIGMAMAEYLAKNAHARLILISRTGLPPRDKWDQLLKDSPENNEKNNITNKIRKIKELEQLGTEILVYSADVTNPHQVQEAITQAEQQWGKINGVIHCAGLPDGEMIQRRTRETSRQILAAKVTGTLVLDKLFSDITRQPDFFILCSSISSIVPLIGQVGYIAANAFLDSYAAYKNINHTGNNAITISVNWDRWQQVGIANIAEKQHKKLTGEKMAGGITSQQALEIFHRILAEPLPQLAVSANDLNIMIKQAYAFKASSFLEGAEGDTPTKIKRKRPDLDSEYVPPKHETQKILAAIWSKFFGFEKIGVQDDFFDLGGDSLKALTILPRIHKTLHVDIPISEFFKRPTIESLAAFIAAATETRDYSPLTPAEEKDYYVLSPAQKRLYILQQIDPQSMGYNIPMMVTLQGNIDRQQLENTFKTLIQRHEGLRTSFFVLDDEPVQRIHDKVKFEIQYEVIHETHEKHEKFPMISDFLRPFDLAQAPLVRVGVIERGEKNHILMVDMHHIVSDGSSHDILTNEFMMLYSGKYLPPLNFQYKDYAEWKNSQAVKYSVKKQEEYWKKQFSRDIPILNLPTDYPRPELQSFAGEELPLVLGKEQTAALKRLAQEERATLYMVLLAIFNVFLAKISAQEDIVVGMDVAGRNHADLETIIGMFVNTLPLRNFPAEEKTFKEFLSEVKEKILSALENQDYPFEDLVETLNVKRDSSRNPLFDVMFSSLDFDAGPGTQTDQITGNKEKTQNLQDLKVKPFSYTNRTAKFDLSLMGKMVGEQLLLTFEYCTKLFKEETIQRFTRYFKEIAASVIKNPAVPIWEIEIITEEERNQLVKTLKNNKATVPLQEVKQDQAEFDF